MNIIITRTRNRGGTMTFMFNFLNNYESSSNDILFLDYFFNRNIYEEITREFNGKIIILPKINTKRIIFYRFLQNIYILNCLRKFKKIDTIYCLDWNIMVDALLHIKSYKFVTFVHSYPINTLPKVMKLITNCLVRNTNIITVSNFSAKKIAVNWHLEKEISVLYHYSKLPGSNKTEDISNKDINVVTIAHCYDYKNPELWVELAMTITKKNNNVRFHWYGNGPLLEKYQKITQNNSQVIFHGHTDNVEDILENHTMIYLQTSKIESLGISILDAMNYSKPSIVTNVGGMPEIVQDQVTGFVSNDFTELVSSIEKLIKNPKYYSEISNNAKKRYEQFFNKQIWDETLNYYLNNN